MLLSAKAADHAQHQHVGDENGFWHRHHAQEQSRAQGADQHHERMCYQVRRIDTVGYLGVLADEQRTGLDAMDGHCAQHHGGHRVAGMPKAMMVTSEPPTLALQDASER